MTIECLETFHDASCVFLRENNVQMSKAISEADSYILKGQCHEIFECRFFHQIAPPGPIRGTLARFQSTEIFKYEILGRGVN